MTIPSASEGVKSRRSVHGRAPHSARETIVKDINLSLTPNNVLTSVDRFVTVTSTHNERHTPMTTQQIVEEIRNGRKNLAGANLVGANLARADLQGADLDGADLVGSNLVRANLARAALRGADLDGADLARANLVGSNLVRANLARADLARADLRGANLRVADLARADLQGANLRGADLRVADLAGADLAGADLAEANLSESRGLMWAQQGPIGTDRRTLTGAIIGAGITLFAGCFTGTPAEFRTKCETGGAGWSWPEDFDALRDECLEACDYIVTSLNRQAVQR